MTSCANRGIGPQGGPKDSIPPVLVRSIPENGALNYSGKKIDLYFDEYLQLDNIAENVLISPAQREQPDIKLVGKHISVVFKDTLRDSTTYTIDFGRAICDFREKNPIEEFTFAFSTGDQIDSLEAYGRLINAEDLNPVLGALVGLHAEMTDTTLQTQQFSRITKTDSLGLFAMRNIRAGSYHIFAVADLNRDYMVTPGEPMAFLDSMITPYSYTDERLDTVYAFRYDSVWTDSITYTIDTVQFIDTVYAYIDTYMEPGNLLLWLSADQRERRYFQRCLRDERHRVKLVFSHPQDSLPALSADWIDSTTIISRSDARDTIYIWLTDSMVRMQDSLFLTMRYMKTDSLLELVEQTDTVYAVYREPKMSEKNRAALRKKEAERPLSFKANGGTSFGANDTLAFRFATPVLQVTDTMLRLYAKRDTVYTPMPFTLLPDDSTHLVYRVYFDYQPGRQYELRMDSAAFVDIYGHATNKQKVQMQIRSLEEYTTLRIKSPDTGERLVLQLLDEQDKVLRTIPQTAEGVQLRYLEPKIYYLRLFIDENGDGKWTGGNWEKRRHPEPVYYFPKRLNLRANWDFEEHFDYRAVPQLQSKPDALYRTVTGTKEKKK